MQLMRRGLLALVLLMFALAPAFALPLVNSATPTARAPRSSTSTLANLVATLAAAGAVAGVIRIKDTASIAKKFVNRASSASGDYTEGVRAAGADWEANTKASEDNYKLGVTQAANDGRFGRGVAAAGAAKYVDRAATLGSQRYPTGIAAAEGAYSRNVQPFLDTMKSLDLPARRPKGDPANVNRVAIVNAALRKLRLGK